MKGLDRGLCHVCDSVFSWRPSGRLSPTRWGCCLLGLLQPRRPPRLNPSGCSTSFLHQVTEWCEINELNQNDCRLTLCTNEKMITHLAAHHMMETVWVEHQRKVALFYQDTEGKMTQSGEKEKKRNSY